MRVWGVAMLALLIGCSRDDHDAAIAQAIIASKGPNGAAGSVPTLVREQQRKELIRQNTEWTKENQALYPIEYCQAQLAELDRMAKSLQVQVHTVATSKTAIDRQDAEERAQEEGLTRILAEAKESYRSADAKNEWPMTLNGFRLSKARAEEKIVEMAHRIAALKASIGNRTNLLATYEKRRLRLGQEQRKLVLIREKVQMTLNDLQAKRVIDGTNGISDALNAIQDSMMSLGTDLDNPSLDELALPDQASDRQKIFAEIMAE